jgi:membrane-bound metal-dependent hydrolase YbcI (DUF457 family)
MSNYQGHLYAGTVTFLLFLGALIFWFFIPSELELLMLFGICLFAALLPDIDTKSVGQKLFYRALFILDMLLIASQRYKEAALLGLVAMLPILGKHRGWTHTLWAAFLLPLPLLLFPAIAQHGWTPFQTIPSGELVRAGAPYYAAAVLGYLSHLLKDRKFFR